MRKLITTLAVCALFVPAFSTPVLAEEPMDTWEVDVCGDDMKELENLPELPNAEPLWEDMAMKELENLPELPNAEPLWEDMAVSSRAASISVNVQSPLESSWRNRYNDSKYEARKVVERTDDFLSQKFGIEFNVTSQPDWTVGKTTAAAGILKDAAKKHWTRKEDLMIAFAGPIVDTENKATFGVAFNGRPSTAAAGILKDAAKKHWTRKEDLMIAFAGPIVDTENKATFGVAFNGRPFSLIFDHRYNQNCKSTQHEIGHTYGLKHCNDTCVMKSGWDDDWELFDHLCSSHEQQWNKNKNKYHH